MHQEALHKQTVRLRRYALSKESLQEHIWNDKPPRNRLPSPTVTQWKIAEQVAKLT